MNLNLQAPEPLSQEHDLSHFCSGNEELNDWLTKRAFKNFKNRASNTFVLTIDKKVIGYYALSSGSIYHKEAYKKLRRNMPNPIPAVTLGRLAVDIKYQKKGLGSALLRDALLRILTVANNDWAIKAVLVHAIDQEAIKFYSSKGFHKSPINDSTLMISVDEIESSLI